MELPSFWRTTVGGAYVPAVLGGGLDGCADWMDQCTTAENYLVAHYDLKPPNVRVFDVSGNTLTVYEPFVHVALGESWASVGSDTWASRNGPGFGDRIEWCWLMWLTEIITSLIIMRHLAEHKLWGTKYLVTCESRTMNDIACIPY